MLYNYLQSVNTFFNFGRKSQVIEVNRDLLKGTFNIMTTEATIKLSMIRHLTWMDTYRLVYQCYSNIK